MQNEPNNLTPVQSVGVRSLSFSPTKTTTTLVVHAERKSSVGNATVVFSASCATKKPSPR